MKYGVKHPDMVPGEIRGSVLKVADWDRCAYCQDQTAFVDVIFEASLCSEECVEGMWNELANTGEPDEAQKAPEEYRDVPNSSNADVVVYDEWVDPSDGVYPLGRQYE